MNPGASVKTSFRLGGFALILFATGASALIYQVVWMREFRLVFGGSTAASAAVLSAFMGGLGIGALALGRFADRHPNPLRLYAILEFGTAGLAALTPLLLIAANGVYAAVGAGDLGSGAVTVMRVLMAVLVVGLPAFLMGGSLPAAARAAETDADPSRRALALLYGVNAVGAVAGVALATFWMIESLGQRGTLWLACAVNAAVAIVPWIASKSATGSPRQEPINSSIEIGPNPASAPLPLVLGAAAITGFVFFLMELVWYRMLTPLLGGTTFSMGLILCIALAGLGAGGGAYALLRKTTKASLPLFAFTCVLEATFLSLPLLLGDWLAITSELLRPLGALGFFGHVLGWTAITGIVVFPAALVAGFQFPLLIALLGQGRRNIGRDTGLAYAFNTFGAISGALGGGFGLLPLLSAPGAWRLSIVVMLALGGIVWLTLITRREHRKVVGLALPTFSLFFTVFALLALHATGPTSAWRHSGIGAGRAAFPQAAHPNEIKNWANTIRRSVVWETDGVESAVSIANASGDEFVINGKGDGRAREDADRQVMSGLLGGLLHGDVKSGLVVGLGTGTTAGWLAEIPSVEQLDVVELEPKVLDVARLLAPVNRGVMDNPKVRIHTGDAREKILTTGKRYDLILSEPSNPYRAGVASLFTREYYQAAASKLKEGGLFLQWTQTYEIDAHTFRLVVATLRSVFPEIQIWEMSYGDVLFIASSQPVGLDADKLRNAIAEEPFRSALMAAWRVDTVEGIFARFIGDTKLASQIAASGDGRINSDDRNYLEFAFARTLGNNYPGGFQTRTLREAALRTSTHRPEVTGRPIDWSKVADNQVAMATALGFSTLVESQLSPAQQIRYAAWRKGAVGSLREAFLIWSSGAGEPTSPGELSLVAEILADQGDDRAEPYVDALRALLPGEADLIKARLRWRQGRLDEAAQNLEVGLRFCRTDPWVQPTVLERSLGVLEQIVAADPQRYGERLRTLLEAPFSVHLANDLRRRILLRVSQYMDLTSKGEWTIAALLDLEPHVPWNASFLALREKTYREHSHPNAAQALRDLRAYQSAASPAEIVRSK